MAVLDDMDGKLDELLSIMKDEINIHPDVMRAGAVAYPPLQLTINMSASLSCAFEVVDRDGARWLDFKLKGVFGEPLIYRSWRCVYRDPMTPGVVIDRPGNL